MTGDGDATVAVATPTQAWTAVLARLRAASRAVAAHDVLTASVVCCVVTALLLGPHILHGGFESDDWAVFAAVRFPAASGHASSFSALAASAGSRIGAIVYWFAIFSLFGTHAKLYLGTAAVLTAAMAVTLYVAMRTAGFSRTGSFAVMLLSLALPAVDASRLWIITTGGQICFVFYFLGLAAALRAYDGDATGSRRWQVVSVLLYVASAAYAEIAMPLVAASVLVYATRTSWRRAIKRWAVDLVIVAGCYAGTLVFVGASAGYKKIPASQWWTHALAIYGQALTIFSGTVVPFGNGSHILIVVLVSALAVGAIAVLRGKGTRERTRRDVRRWGAAFGIAVVAAFFGWGTYIPGMVYYDPLDFGLASHINLVADAPLAVAAVAVVMVARSVLEESLSRLRGRGDHHRPRAVAAAAAAFATAWFAYAAVDGSLDVRADAANWSTAAGEQYHVLNVVKAALPHPVAQSAIITFGEPATAASGLPVFVSPWELDNALKITYNRPDISGYPVLAGVSAVACGPDGVSVNAGPTPMAATPSRYGHTYFVNTDTGAVVLVRNRASCAAEAASLPPGPYDLGPAPWAI